VVNSHLLYRLSYRGMFHEQKRMYFIMTL